MNGARSTFMRKGYLLTALAAAVLLAASSGTAWAQSVGFVGTSGTVAENADADPNTPAPGVLKVIVRRSGNFTGPNADDIGDITLDHNAVELGATIATSGVDDDGAAIGDLVGDGIGAFPEGKNEIVLTIIPTVSSVDWKDETLVLKLVSDALGVAPSPSVFRVTIRDIHNQPEVMFTKTSISLTEDSSTSVDVKVDLGKPEAMRATMLDETGSKVKILISGAVVGLDCGALGDGTMPAVALNGNGFGELMQDAKKNTYIMVKSSISTLVGAVAQLNVEACADSVNFRDASVMLKFDPTSLKTEGGDVKAGPALSITTQSDEAKPTVSFLPANLLIDEGGTDRVSIMADGKLGAEVGSVDVEVSGDAMISLWDGGDPIDANADGSYTVVLGDSANKVLTISADSDPSLEDGQQKTATVTLVSASGAVIGSEDSVTVTVNGSTAVPALPLLGQLLLALFLMAGGAQLYRRRQG